MLFRSDQPAGMQPTDQITAYLLAEDVLEPVPGDRLVIGDGGQHRDIVFAQIEVRIATA